MNMKSILFILKLAVGTSVTYSLTKYSFSLKHISAKGRQFQVNQYITKQSKEVITVTIVSGILISGKRETIQYVVNVILR